MVTPADMMMRWHHSLHQITGEMCKFFGRQPGPGELAGWSRDLRAVADEMATGAADPVMAARYKKGSAAAIAQSSKGSLGRHKTKDNKK